MRILVTTRGSSGHLLPLAPVGRAALRAGHEVLVAAQRPHGANVARTGLPFAPVDAPAPERTAPLLARLPAAGLDEAHAGMIGEYFAELDAEAALPGLEAIVADLAPDVIVRDAWEFGSTLVAERHGLPVVRVGLGLADVEERSIGLAAPALDRLRAGLGLAPDPDGARLRATPYVTTVPAALEDPGVALTPAARRFAHPAGGDAAPLPHVWPREDDPLVYLTFGTVAGAAHLPYWPDLVAAAIGALAALPIRLLVTVGDGPDPEALGPLPSNVHVERWIAQDAVLARAAVVVCHGGHGTVLGALAHGVPLVVLPLFSLDQWANADAVARAGLGVALDAERDTRRALAPPSRATLAELAPAVARVLADRLVRYRALDVAAEMRALPPLDAVVDLLAEVAGAPAPRRRRAAGG